MKPLVLHVLPFDLARGAQVYARALRDALNSERVEHRVVTLFRGEPGILKPDDELGLSRRFRRYGFDPRAPAKLWRFLRRRKPAVIVTHGAEPLKYTLLAGSKTPLVHYRIGISAVRSGPRRALLAAQHRRPDVVAGVSNECLEDAIELFGVDRERCVLIANGRDPARYEPADTPPEVPTLLFLGHFAPTKRPEVFVEVVERLQKRGLEFQAAMIGSGDGLEPLRQRAEDAGIHLYGRREDVPELLKTASIFLFTSIPEGEGMPGVFIEAGMAGLPTVATRVPGAATVIEEGHTGYIVDPHDLDAMTDRVATLLEDAPLRERMGRAARERCIGQFTLEQSFDRWREVLAPFVGSHT